MEKKKFNWIALLFGAAYYAGYGKPLKAVIMACIGFLPLTNIPVLIYAGFKANSELPVKKVPFLWVNAIGVVFLQIAITYVVITITGYEG